MQRGRGQGVKWRHLSLKIVAFSVTSTLSVLHCHTSDVKYHTSGAKCHTSSLPFSSSLYQIYSIFPESDYHIYSTFPESDDRQPLLYNMLMLTIPFRILEKALLVQVLCDKFGRFHCVTAIFYCYVASEFANKILTVR